MKAGTDQKCIQLGHGFIIGGRDARSATEVHGKITG